MSRGRCLLLVTAGFFIRNIRAIFFYGVGPRDGFWGSEYRRLLRVAAVLDDGELGFGRLGQWELNKYKISAVKIPLRSLNEY